MTKILSILYQGFAIPRRDEMKRHEDRNQMIAAFRKYSRLGLASKRLDPFDAYDRIRGCCSTRSEARRLLAVYDTVRFLRLTGNKDSLRAVYAIYFSFSPTTIRANDISRRIVRHAYENSCDERTVYRRLAYAVSVYRKMLADAE